MGIRLVVVDDNPHLTWEGRTHPVNATFHRFLSAILDVEGAPVASIVHAVPLRAAGAPPATLPLDPRIEVVGTAPFDGIEGYLRHLPAMLRANRPILRRAIAGADLLWLKVPASNAALAAAIAARAGVPRFVWVAGSAAGVARARHLGVSAEAVGLVYDIGGRLAAVGGDRLVVGADLGASGVVTSLVEPHELRDPAERTFPRRHDRLVLAWAGRVADGKGLDWLLAEVRSAADAWATERSVELIMVGDGPARAGLMARSRDLGLGERVRWLGHVAERAPYLDLLAEADAFVFPSDAEGFPKVVLDAMAVGLPVLARPAGSLAQLDPGSFVRLGDLAAAVRSLDTAGQGSGWADQAARGHAFAAAHTRPAEAARLAKRWQARWPGLPWSAPSG